MPLSQAASRVSVHPEVRKWMVEKQRQLGAGGGVVMEGRDVGTKIFPNADVKIFLEASPDVRMERRLKQYGGETERIAAELRERDARDRSRAASPLVPAPDAVVLDSSHLSIDEVVDKIEEIIARKLNR